LSDTYVSLTFDDGYLEHYEVAEILSSKGIRATFFLITHLRDYNGKALLTTRPELVRKIHQMGHEVASHTRTHPLLTVVPSKVVEEECSASRNYLSELIESEITGFAYPYGAYNNKVANIVKKYYGYARITGAFNRWNTESIDRYVIGGMGIRHLIKLPLNLVRPRETRYLVLVFHDDPPKAIVNAVRLLRLIGGRFATLSELAEKRSVGELGMA